MMTRAMIAITSTVSGRFFGFPGRLIWMLGVNAVSVSSVGVAEGAPAGVEGAVAAGAGASSSGRAAGIDACSVAVAGRERGSSSSSYSRVP